MKITQQPTTTYGLHIPCLIVHLQAANPITYCMRIHDRDDKKLTSGVQTAEPKN